MYRVKVEIDPERKFELEGSEEIFSAYDLEKNRRIIGCPACGYPGNIKQVIEKIKVGEEVTYKCEACGVTVTIKRKE